MYKVNVPITYQGLSAPLTMKTFIKQAFGIAFEVKAPKFVLIGEKKNKEKVFVSVANVQILASFDTIAQADVSSVSSLISTQGSSVTGYFYPGGLAAPSGASTCCGEGINVAVLITLELSGSGPTTEIEVFVTRQVVLRCVQYEECALGFSRMSETEKCPSCEN